MISRQIDRLQACFRRELPGRAAQILMAPSLRPAGSGSFDGSNPLSSGVMLLLFPDGNEISTVFMLRTDGGPHGGQISLPGGKREPGDRNLRETAKRETFEEMGVDPGMITDIGLLTPLYVPHSNYCIQPVVGYLDSKPVFIPDNKEVAEIIVVPLSLLFDPASRKTMTLHHDELEIIAPYYQAGEHRIWGATAMIVSEFEQVFTSCISG